MIDWWFGYVRTTEQYRRWHPTDHVWCDWEGAAGEYVGGTHLVHEYIGGQLNKLRIEFVSPAEFFGDALARVPGAVAICARPGLLEQPVDLGRMVHLALPTEWGCELHSRFWLGYVRSRNGSDWIERVGNLGWIRRRRASLTMGRALLAHCHEEMTTLAGFLPGLYACHVESLPARTS